MKSIKKTISSVLSATMIISSLPAFALPSENVEANETEVKGNILHYDMTINNGYVVDTIGNHNGVVKNLTEEDITSTSVGNTLFLNNGTSPVYIEIPDGTVNNLDEVTMSALVKWNGGVNASWLYTLGTNSGNYLFATPSNNSNNLQVGMAAGSDLSGWKTEKQASDSQALDSNVWSLITITFSGEENTLTLYKDGELIVSNRDINYELSDIITEGIANGYIGKSLYTNDPYFTGELADFKIFNRALNGAEVSTLKNEADELILPLTAEALSYSYILNENKDENSVVGDLYLPSDLGNGVTVSWTSSNTEIISPTGKVVRPASDKENTEVNLKAIISLNDEQIKKEFKITVLKEESTGDKLAADKENLIVNNINNIRGNITLTIKGGNGSEITWTSSAEDIISSKQKGDIPAGVVTRPEYGADDSIVELKATLSLAGETVEKEFVATVKAKPKEEVYDAYLFTYFTNEDEQIYFGASEDGLNWDEINDSEPVLTSVLGDMGVRDPFIIRSPEGDKFYLIATDLRIANGAGWGAAQNSGSRCIMVWESEDLVNWSDQRMVHVALDTAGCTWAPEAFYDATTGEYIVFWASRDNARPDDSGNYHHRIYYTKTRDFYTFTEPEIYYSQELDNNSANDVIDMTIIEEEGTYYRFIKDEVSKFIFMEKSESLLGQWTAVDTNISDIKNVEGPTCFKFNDSDKWCLLVDEYGGRKYFPLVTNNLAEGQFEELASSEYSLPKGASSNGPRHGTVLNITREEYNNLMVAYANKEITVLEDNIPKAVLNTEDGSSLPVKVKIKLNGTTSETKIKWNINEDTFKNTGVTTVTGNIPAYDLEVSYDIRVISEKLIYFIDSSVETSPVFEDIKNLVQLKNNVADKPYEEGSYGYNDQDNLGRRDASGSRNEYDTGWYAKNGKDITYTIPLEKGTYSVTTGFEEWWNVNRTMNFYIEYTDENKEEVIIPVEEGINISGTDRKDSNGEFILPIDTEVTFRIGKVEGSDDPVISYLYVEDLSKVDGGCDDGSKPNDGDDTKGDDIDGGDKGDGGGSQSGKKPSSGTSSVGGNSTNAGTSSSKTPNSIVKTGSVVNTGVLLVGGSLFIIVGLYMAFNKKKKIVDRF